MPPRPPLAVISSNEPFRRELSYGTKRQLLGRSLAGQTATKIGEAEGLPRTTVRDVLHRAELNNNVDTIELVITPTSCRTSACYAKNPVARA
jgi:hypothetical protein